MSSARDKRLAREVADCKRDTKSGITVETIGESSDLTHLIGSFPGPAGSPYEGGVFEVDIVIPDQYPFLPLKMKFITKVYHPNISSQSGAICLDILKDAWSPVLTLKTALVSLQSLLTSPEPNDPQDAEVAKHYLTDRQAFEKTARYWTEVYARPKTAVGATTTAVDTSTRSGTAGPNRPSKVDQVALSGLDPLHVDQFVGMGFEQDQVIDVLKRLNYRGKNVQSISDDQVVEALLR